MMKVKQSIPTERGSSDCKGRWSPRAHMKTATKKARRAVAKAEAHNARQGAQQ